MATTISLPTAVSSNSISGNNLFAEDGTLTTGLWSNAHADVELTNFNSLSITSGATIDGIEVIVFGQGNPATGKPEVQVYNGTSWSSGLAFVGTFSKSNVLYDPGWGANNNLWGLSGTDTTAAAIRVKIDSSTITPAGRRLFWDFVKVRITFTEAAGYANDVSGLPSAEIGEINGVASADIAELNGL